MTELESMPAEILYAIAPRVSTVASMAAFCALFGLDFYRVLASSHHTVPLDRLLEGGAPLDVVRRPLRRYPRARWLPQCTVPFGLLMAGIRGGRTDVVAHLHDAASADTVGRLVSRYGTYCEQTHDRLQACVERVLVEAVVHGRHAVLAWLLEFYGRPSFSASTAVFDRGVLYRLMALAVDTRHAHTVDTVRALHGPYAGGKRCRCPRMIADRASAFARQDVLDALHGLDCCAVARPSVGRAYHKHATEWEIKFGTRADIALTSKAVQDLSRARLHDPIRHVVLCGNTSTLRAFYDMGMTRAVSDAVIAAADHGRLDVILWAMSDLSAPDTAYSGASWHAVVVAAHRSGHRRIVDWVMSDGERARRCRDIAANLVW